MTNPYFDQAQASPYEGGFKICPDCVTVVPSVYADRHERECKVRGETVARVDQLEDAQTRPLQVEDVHWDDQDPTA